LNGTYEDLKEYQLRWLPAIE